VTEIHIVVSLILIVLILLDLTTSASRAGYRSVSRAQMLKYNGEHNNHADWTMNILDKLPKAIASLHLFQMFLRFLIAGSVLFLFFGVGTSPWSTIGLLVALLSAALVLATLEWLFSRWAARETELWVLRTSIFTRVLMVIMAPFVVVALALTRESPDLERGAVTVEEEVKTLVDAGQKEGELELEERKMIYSVFQLGDTLTREIMVPRIDMVALDVDTPLMESADVFISSGYSRVPVYENTIDNILGVLYAKDLLKSWREGSDGKSSVRSLLRDAYFVPEAKKVDDLLTELQARRVHLAIVIDEYGGVAGLVTLEDIIEEIFGEIQDEYDEEDQPYQILENGDYLFQGRVDLDDFNEIMGCSLPKDEAETIGGFIYKNLGHVPSSGEIVQVNGIMLTVEQVSNRQIKTVRVQNVPGETNREQ